MTPSSTTPSVVLERCPSCGSRERGVLGERSDGIPVYRCGGCGMGYVARHPRDLCALYGDDYFEAAEGTPASGYAEYEAVSAHSTRWAAQLVSLLVRSGDVLDVGCASGDLLLHLPAGLGRCGVEPSTRMAARCREAGIEVLAADVADPALVARYRRRFAAVTAVAVLEHLADMATALIRIRELLAPGGVFLFEVPLVSERIDSSVWFRSSLEHVHYPTVEGLRHAVHAAFGRELVGSEIGIEGYGPTYVGLVGADDVRHAELARQHARLFLGPVAGLDGRELTFRFMLDVIHAARSDEELLRALPQIPDEVLDRGIRARIAQLWSRDVAALRDDEARAGLRAEVENLRRTEAVLRKEIEAVTEAREFHAGQAERWQAAAEKAGRDSAEALAVLRTELAAITEARDYQRNQAENWEREARSLAAMLDPRQPERR